MRYLKLASNKNPDTDYIDLNGGYFDSGFTGFNGFLCTSFQTLGISRKLEFLAIKNRQFSVENKTNFKKYNLTIEIFGKYSEYEAKHRELILFLDRNKKDGFRLYFSPYGNNIDDIRYCLCDIEMSQRPEKMQPVGLTLTQNSLWMSKLNIKSTAYIVEEHSNLFAFKDDDGYYSAGFILDNDVANYYCLSFFSGVETQAEIVNNGYNEIPLNIKIYGKCVNPTVSLYRKNEDTPIRTTQITANVDDGYYLEINPNVLENGVWYVNKTTQEKISYEELVNNEYGSPYFYIDHGEYFVVVKDEGNNTCLCEVSYREEFSE